MRVMLFLLVSVFCLAAQGDPPATATAPAAAAQLAQNFLKSLEEGAVDEAVQLWDARAVNENLKARVERMSSKVRDFGGISRVDVGSCEPRRIEAFQKKTGEKIDVVPVEIICGNESLILAVFSIRRVNGQQKIFELESLKEWGGTHSLDEELGYRH